MTWEVEIIGDRKDLKALTQSFRNEDLILDERKGEFVLCGRAFSSFQEAEEVIEHGRKIAQHLSGAARILLGSSKKIMAGAAFKIGENGGRDIFVKPAPATCRVDVTFSAVVIRNGEQIVEEHRPGDLAPDWVKAGLRDEDVAKALRLRDDGDLDWVQLYRLFDVIGSDISVRKGWITKKKASLLKHTASSAGATGDQARHGKDRHDPPPNPMNLSEGRGLVDDVLKKWLLWKVSEKKC